MRTPFRLILLAALATLVATALGSGSDVRFGGARTFGLAGAGIALPLDTYETFGLNPALLGFDSKRFRVGLPYIGYHTKDISLGQVNDLIGNASSGGVSDDEAVRLARKYGSNTKELGVNAGGGLTYKGFALGFRAEALVRSVPNQALSNFLATNDDDYRDAPIDSRLDAYGLGYYQTTLAYGREVSVPRSRDRFSLGLAAREVTAIYAHKVADATAIAGDGDVRNGSEISGDDDMITRSGFGLDFGGVAALHAVPNAYFGFSVRNLVEPNVTFVRTAPNTDFPLIRDFRPFKRQIGVGAAYVKERYLVALDAVDLGGHGGNSGVRLGAEYSINKHFAIRGGYDSRSKFVAGVCVGGVNAAISADGTTSVVSQIKF